MGFGPFSSSSETRSDTRNENNAQTLSGNAQGFSQRKGGIGNTEIRLGKGAAYNVTNTYTGLDTAQLGKVFGVLGSAVGAAGGTSTFPMDEARDQAELRGDAAEDENKAFSASAMMRLALIALAVVAVVAVVKVFFGKKKSHA
jgi:hypothetical protein